jgi:hypothetical protein
VGVDRRGGAGGGERKIIGVMECWSTGVLGKGKLK